MTARRLNPHGTPHRYWQGCRCFHCRVARCDYERDREKGGYIPADDLRDHIAYLRNDLGMSLAHIAHAAEVDRTGLFNIVAGQPSVQIRVYEAVMGVNGSTATSMLVGARNTRRLVARMKAAGITRAQMAEASCLSIHSIAVLSSKSPKRYVEGRTARAIMDAAVALGVHRLPVDMERYDELAARGLSEVEIAAELGISLRHAYRLASTQKEPAA